MQKTKTQPKPRRVDIRKYCKWAEKTKNVKEIQNVEKNELNIILENFFADVTRDDGKQLEPISLYSMQAALYRYLKDNGWETYLFV